MEYSYEKEPDFSSLTAALQQLSEVEEQPEPDPRATEGTLLN